MSARLLTALSRISHGTLVVAGALIVAAVLFEAWMVVLRQPFAAYRDLATTREALRAIEQMTATQERDLRRASERAQELSERLRLALHQPAPDEQLTVSLMRKLDKGAAGAGIALTSLKPAGRRPVLSFEEMSFDVGARGKYVPLCEWLLNFERSIGGSATVTEFTMRSADEGRQVSMDMKLALYRPAQAAGGDK